MNNNNPFAATEQRTPQVAATGCSQTCQSSYSTQFKNIRQ